ncbi:glycosyltransferase family 2 protein [Roseibacillus persicicus]|uniref:glycosyltransferase family 2 protein n=1 Tax=Roseibacillus persicicus TaxID=454148 RepID=UPI00280C6031|nr:glycosyltransferase family 2 protein [Roseibacillus persicicus]MDQ8190593.1 glycosyltransferase family 2 protein [Roseibacillus persicicus]
MSSSEPFIGMITVCIPSYNGKKYLGKALESVKEQTFRDWSLVVVEDGSYDGAESLVNQFSKEVKNRIRYIRHSENLGLPYARDTAIAAADTRYIALLDADDVWLPNHLESLYNTAEKYNSGITFSGHQVVSHDLKEKYEIHQPEQSLAADLTRNLYLRKFTIQPSASLICSSVFEIVGAWSDENVGNSCEDINFWFRACSKNIGFACSYEPSCLYRKHDNVLSSDGLRMTEALANIYLKTKNYKMLPARLRRQMIRKHCFHVARMKRTVDLGDALRWFSLAISASFMRIER